MTSTRTTHGTHGHIYAERDGTFRAISTLRDMGGKFGTIEAARNWLDMIHGA